MCFARNASGLMCPVIKVRKSQKLKGLDLTLFQFQLRCNNPEVGLVFIKSTSSQQQYSFTLKQFFVTVVIIQALCYIMIFLLYDLTDKNAAKENLTTMHSHADQQVIKFKTARIHGIKRLVSIIVFIICKPSFHLVRYIVMQVRALNSCE
jgi:hypothetical protein